MKPCRYGFMGVVVLLDESLDGFGDFDGIEILALDVLDESQFERSVGGDIFDDDEQFFEACALGGSPSTFSCDDFEAVWGGWASTHDQRFDETVFFQGGSKLIESGRIHALAWLAFLWMQRLDGAGKYGTLAVGCSRCRVD
jgi:hypothetical protein